MVGVDKETGAQRQHECEKLTLTPNPPGMDVVKRPEKANIKGVKLRNLLNLISQVRCHQ